MGAILIWAHAIKKTLNLETECSEMFRAFLQIDLNRGRLHLVVDRFIPL